MAVSIPDQLVDALLTDPTLSAALVVVLRLALAWQRGLSWQEYRAIHAAKRATFPTLQRFTPPQLSFVNVKGYRGDAEYLATRAGSLRAVARELRRGGGAYHLVSSIKRRDTPQGVQYSAAHLVWSHADGQQTEAYLFHAPDGGVDVYTHSEASPSDPLAHLDGPQTDGDPYGVVHRALGITAGK